MLIFLGKETHSETKIRELVEDFDENYNNNGKPWKSSRILCVNPNFFIFSFFIIFSFFFHFSCSFMFCHVLSCSFMFFHFLSFSFILFFLLGAENLIFFGLNFVTISLDSSNVKNHFFEPSRGAYFKKNFGPSFSLFLLFFSPVFFVFFCLLFFFFLLCVVCCVFCVVCCVGCCCFGDALAHMCLSTRG